MDWRKSWRHQSEYLMCVLPILLSHALLAVFFLGIVKGLEITIHRFWESSSDGRLLFGKLPLEYVFHAAHLAIIVVLSWKGLSDVIAKCKEERDEEVRP